MIVVKTPTVIVLKLDLTTDGGRADNNLGGLLKQVLMIGEL